jgi:hypothetical protein
MAPPLTGVSGEASLIAPTDITRTGWAPFRRLCIERSFRRDGSPDPGPTQTHCLRIAAQRDATLASAWRLHIQPEPRGTAAAPLFTALRRDDGALSDITAERAGGTMPLGPEQQARLVAEARAIATSLGLPRQRIAPGTAFPLPMPLVIEDQRTTPTLDCIPEATAQRAGRAVVVVRCVGRAEGRMNSNAGGAIALAGRFAIDIETGVLVAQGYAAHLILRPDAGPVPVRPSTTLIRVRAWIEGP